MSISLRRVVIAALAAIAGTSMFAYAQQSPSATRRIQIERRREMPTAPPLPFAAATAPATDAAGSGTRGVPPMPTYQQYLAAKRARRPLSASGGTICVTLPGGGSTCNPGTGSTQIIPLNSAVSWNSTQLPDNVANHYSDYMLAPNQTTPQFVAGPYTGPTGTARPITLSQQGVYVFGALDTGHTPNTWDALVYIVVGSSATMETYADTALAQPQQTFLAGNPIYINTVSLTPTDKYVYTVENTSVTGNCVFTFPASTQGGGPCNANLAGLTGTNATTSGNLFATWNTTTALSAGTYSVSLYDQTTNQRLSQRQIAVTGASQTASMTFNSAFGGGGTLTNITRIAYNGGAPFTDNSAVNAQILGSMSGLPANTGVSFVLSDPNGTVLVKNANVTSSTTGTLTNVPIYTLNGAQSPRFFGPNTYTVSAVQTSTMSANPPTIYASKSVQVLGYSTNVTYSDGTVAASTSNSTTPASVTKGIIYTNDGESHFGRGNADPIVMIVTSTQTGVSKYPYIAWDPSVTTSACNPNPGTITCAQASVLDSNYHQWIVQVQCSGTPAGCSGAGNGSQRSFQIVSTPVQSGGGGVPTYGLPPNATLQIPLLTFYSPSNTGCGSGCNMSTQIQPLDGFGLDSPGGNSSIANDVVLLDNPGVTYALAASVSVYGTRAAGNIVTGRLVQGDTQSTAYLPRYASMTYDNGQPRSSSISGIKQILAINLTNNSGTGAPNITQLAIALPSQYSSSSVAVDTGLNANWTSVTCTGNAPASAFCVQTSVPLVPASSTGTHSDVIYLDVDPPSTSFAPSAVSLLVLNTPNFGATASGSNVSVAAGTPSTLTPLQLASYSLSGSLMTLAAVPSTIGQGSATTARTQNVGMQFTNTPAASDVFPDDVDALLFQVDAQTTTTLTWPTIWTTSPSNWTLLDTWTSGTQTNYLFGLCAAQDNRAAIPTTSLPSGQSLPTCSGTPNEATDSLLAGSTFTAQGSGTVKNGTGTVTGRVYAHGSNGNGWSQAIPYTLSVTNSDAASAGFTTVNGVPLAIGAQPTVGGDPSTTTGSSFQYNLNNTGNTTITSITIKVPGPDNSGASDQEASGPYFFVTSPGATIKSGLQYTGTGGTLGQCSTVTVTEPTNSGSPIVTTAGSIVLSGCSIPPGYSVMIPFSAKSPSTVNSVYQFSTSFTGSASGVAASETWFSSTQLKISLSATMTISLAPTGTGPSGTSHPNYTGCTLSSGSSTANLSSWLDFGTVPSGVTATCTDALMVSIATNAGGTVGWNLYVTADGNPSNVVRFDVDAGTSSTGNNVTYSNTTYSAVGTTTPGQTLATRPAGNTASRTPYDVITSWQVTPADNIPHTQNLTFTFIAN